MASKSSTTEKNKKLIHNYFILFFLFLICICLVIYMCKIYNLNAEEQKKIPVIGNALSEIYSDDLEHYVMDNPDTVIYLCTANDDSCRTFEKSFKKLLHKKDYNDQIVYLNLTDLEDQDAFVNEFNNKYNYKNPLTTHYPAFVLFEEGKVKSILQGKEEKELKVTKVQQFLELNEIGE